jgi:hypothetical protein
MDPPEAPLLDAYNCTFDESVLFCKELVPAHTGTIFAVPVPVTGFAVQLRFPDPSFVREPALEVPGSVSV